MTGKYFTIKINNINSVEYLKVRVGHIQYFFKTASDKDSYVQRAEDFKYQEKNADLLSQNYVTSSFIYPVDLLAMDFSKRVVI